MEFASSGGLGEAVPLPRFPAAPLSHPSRYAPVKNGLVSRSTPMVVSGPWPLWTRVESGNESSSEWIAP